MYYDVDLLKRLEHIPDASFKSTSSDTAQIHVECTPETRKDILKQLTEWVYDFSTGRHSVFWLNGMAGTGKSTIAQSICNQLHADGHLAASFFCSRSAGGGRNDARRIVPTLAFQLSYYLKSFALKICDILRTPDRIKQPIKTQLAELLWAPLDDSFVSSGASGGHNVTPIIVVDGLDECLDTGAEEFMEALLSRFALNYPVHLRFIIFSRSERHIGIPIENTSVPVTRFVLHDVPYGTVNDDIRRYVETGFAEMTRRKRWQYNWYTLDDIDFIVTQAGVLFIYAATVLKYLAESKLQPQRRLQTLRDGALPAQKGGPLRSLHFLYSIILGTLGAVDEFEGFEADLVRRILFLVTSSPEPLPIHTISDLLASDKMDVWACVHALSSVIMVPDESEGYNKPVKVLHASFSEFLLSSSQHLPTHLRFNIGDMHRGFMLRCLGILQDRLREDQGLILDNDEALAYAARHWTTFLAEASFVDRTLAEDAADELSQFVDAYLLRWLECLLRPSEVQAIIDILQDPDFRSARCLSCLLPR